MQVPNTLRDDIPAGIVVFFVAVPLCLGIALASGAPLFSGLIAGIVGGVIVGALSGSALGVSGPAAGLAVIVFTAIETLGSFEAFLVAVVLAGVIQFGFGLARAGVLAYFFPSAVIKGMLAGIGLLIILKQIPHAIGWDADTEGNLAFQQRDGETTFSGIFRAFENIDAGVTLVAVIALGILVLWDQVLVKRGRIYQLVQGPLVAVCFGVGYQLLASRFAPGWAISADHLVTIPVIDGLSDVGSLLISPDWSQLSNPAVYLTAITLAVVGSLETLLCVEATDKLDPEKRVTPANRELLSQGVGNAISGFFGGLPVTQVIVRSSANIQSGARSKNSAILHGIFLLIAVLLFASVLNRVPLSVLASILFVVGYKLAKPELFVSMYRSGPSQFGPFIVTIAAILMTDLLTGVMLGLTVGVVVILYRSYVNSHWMEVEEHDDPAAGHTVRLRLAEQVSFLSRGAILRQLSEVPDGSHVSIDLRNTVTIDHDVLEILRDFEKAAESRNIDVVRIPQIRSAQALLRVA
ncbi:MAG: MFS superfamily sulfate permease-like transporter [Myxococcota bacterium]|jgi:MFS superfamily sulfate permease-like transporter